MLADLLLDIIPNHPADAAVKLQKEQLNTYKPAKLEASKGFGRYACPYLVISSPSKSTIEFLTLILVKPFSPTAQHVVSGQTFGDRRIPISITSVTCDFRTWMGRRCGGHCTEGSGKVTSLCCVDRCSSSLRQTSQHATAGRVDQGARRERSRA